MNTLRSPPLNITGGGGSHPNLSQLKDIDLPNQITLRKRKTPDCDSVCSTDFRRELSETLSEYRLELRDTLQEFQKTITASFETLVKQQSESIKQIHGDVCHLKSEVSDLKECHQSLRNEHCNIISNITDIDKNQASMIEKNNYLEKELINAKSLASSLLEQQRFADQQARINNLEISGVPQLKGENLYNIVHKMATKINFALLPTDIDFIHRVRRFVGTSTPEVNLVPNIIIKFTQRKKKNEFLAAVRARPNNGRY